MSLRHSGCIGIVLPMFRRKWRLRISFTLLLGTGRNQIPLFQLRALGG